MWQCPQTNYMFTIASQSDNTSALKTIAEDEPIMRTMSSAELVGRLAVLEWEDANEMTNHQRSNLYAKQNQNVPTSTPEFIRRAKQDPRASPYTKVLCKFCNGEHEVLAPPCYLNK
jgi:hypothetical protein